MDLHGVPEESRRVNRWYPGSMHHQGQRVADAVVLYLRTSAVRKHHEAAECARPDRCPKRVYEHQTGLRVPSRQDEPVRGLRALSERAGVPLCRAGRPSAA